MICVPIRQKKTETIIKKIILSEKEADLTEIWFDDLNDLSDLNLKKIFSKRKKPIIYKSLANKENIEKIVEYKPEYIDLDIKTSKKIIDFVKSQSPKTKIIISYHDFNKTPSIKDLNKLVDRIKKKQADIIKIATYANTISDSFQILNFLSNSDTIKNPMILLSMGKEGKITRAAGHLFGNYLMYAPLDKSSKTASGQLTLKELKSCHLK